MPAQVVHVLDGVAQWLEILGATALVVGFAVAVVRYAARTREGPALEAFTEFRRSLGRTVLIGLEILVAATIIKTITIEPTPAALGLLAVMIGIRTILSWTMVLEVTGRWPWSRTEAASRRNLSGDTPAAPTPPIRP